MKIYKTAFAVVATLTCGVTGAAEETATTTVAWSIETGLGYETNAYHAPDHSYADYYADPTGATIVNPTEEAGLFIPLKITAQMANPIAAQTDLVAGYKFSGYYFPESTLNDASSTDHEVRVGADSKLGKGGKKGKAYAGLFVRSHDKVYVDRDSGDPKTSSGGLDVSNRYSYQSFGLEGDYERSLSRKNAVGVKAAYESLDYARPDAWSEYDHTYTMLGAYWNHRLAKGTKLKLGVTSETRDYKYRSSYDASGALVGPLLAYTFMGYDIGISHRFSDRTVAYLDYELLARSDNNVGYNDMDQSKVKLRLIHDLNEKLILRAKVTLTERDYPNAFNFEDPTQGSKSASATDVQLRGEYQYTDNKTYYLELEQNRHDNTDDRYQYNNSAIMLGAKWEF
jgi:hypothetical protein